MLHLFNPGTRKTQDIQNNKYGYYYQYILISYKYIYIYIYC